MRENLNKMEMGHKAAIRENNMNIHINIHKVFLASLAVLFLSMFSLSFVHAQETDTTSTIIGEEETLDGITVEAPKSAPSGFGLWLRDWREKISLALILEPVKKAEKQLLFAEERMKIAQIILAESTSPRAQAKAAKMIEQAQKHIIKIQEKKDKWIEKKEERVEKLKNNLATHELRKDEILAKMEEKLPEEAKAKFEDMREKMLDQAKTFVGIIDDNGLSEKTKEHLEDVRERIESSKAAVSEYRDQKKEILKDVDLSKEEMQEQVRLLWEQRKNKMEEIRLEYKQQKENLKNTFENANEADKIKLEKIKKAKELLRAKNERLKEYAAKVFELRKENLKDDEQQKKVMELKAELDKKTEELENKKEEAGQVKANNAFLRVKQKAEEIRDREETRKEQARKELENEEK